MPAAKHHPETKLQALALYSAHGFNETVRRMRGIVPRATLQNWVREAKKNGMITPPTRSAKLTPELARRKTYNKARRLDLNDKLFYRIEATMKREKNLATNRLKDLALTYAILTDKRRLEEGRETGSALDIEQLEKDVRAMPSIRSSGGSLRAIDGGKKQ